MNGTLYSTSDSTPHRGREEALRPRRSFEPDPKARETLSANLQLNNLADKVEIESLALFDQEGEHTFFSKGRIQCPPWLDRGWARMRRLPKSLNTL